VLEFLWGAKGLKLTPARVNMLPKNLPAGEIPPLTGDASNAVLRVMFPMEPTGPRAWHDVLVRGTGPKLELWLDGVLLDEEFPVGTTRPATAPRFFGAAQLADGSLQAGFRGLIDHAALWHRALSEAEIVALSGGADWTRQRELAILGAPPEQMQYYRPRGHNSKAGDCFPLFHDGTYHLLTDKTLVAWVSPADLDQQGAGVLTVEGAGIQAGQFDSLVLGEAAPRRWMAGSDNFRRTQRDQRHNAEEIAKPGEWVQIAAVYAGNTVTLYRNGSRYARYEIENPLHFAAGGCWLVCDTWTGGTNPRPTSAERSPTRGSTIRR